MCVFDAPVRAITRPPKNDISIDDDDDEAQRLWPGRFVSLSTRVFSLQYGRRCTGFISYICERARRRLSKRLRPCRVRGSHSNNELNRDALITAQLEIEPAVSL